MRPTISGAMNAQVFSDTPTRAEHLLIWFMSALLDDKEPLRVKAFAFNLDGLVREALAAEHDEPDDERASAIRVAQAFISELRSTRTY